MKTTRVIGGLMCVSGTLAAAGNWFWLVGLAVKPPSDLMDARWFYAAMAYVIGGSIIAMGEVP